MKRFLIFYFFLILTVSVFAQPSGGGPPGDPSGDPDCNCILTNKPTKHGAYTQIRSAREIALINLLEFHAGRLLFFTRRRFRQWL